MVSRAIRPKEGWMAAERLSMRNIREILRQKWLLCKPYREIAKSVGVSLGAVNRVIHRATAAGLDWEQVERQQEEALEASLYGWPGRPRSARRPVPDLAYIHAERMRPGVTLELLHHEYLQEHPDGYRYTQFCDLYRKWARQKRLSMRQVHRAGEKLFVDYSGKKPSIVNLKTGESVRVELFVAVLGASNYTYVEATRTQKVHDWIGSHERCFAFLGGVTRDIVPDQLKSGVRGSCRYEPKIQKTYEEFATHYGTTVLPARPGRPKDKAKAEVAVQIAQRWVLGRLRKRKFFSLEELNEAIFQQVDDLNGRTMKTYNASRRELFERLDRPALLALPQQRFVITEWKKARVNIDYHVEVDKHYYSVPFTHAYDCRTGQRVEVDVCTSAGTVEIFLRNQRIASHPKSSDPGRHTTQSSHMPVSHRAHAEWSPSRLIDWAATIGPKTAELVQAILTERYHPEQGYRSCLGILRLRKKYGAERLEEACAKAVAARARSYRHVESVLKTGLDRMAPAANNTNNDTARPTHQNVRGSHYYR